MQTKTLPPSSLLPRCNCQRKVLWQLTAHKTFRSPFFCSVILKIHSSLQMEGETSPIFERRATVSLKEKVNSLENKFLGMRQSIVEDIKKDLREELREGTQNIEEYDSEALLKEEKMISKMKAEIKQEVMDDIKTEMSQSLKGLFEQNIRMFDDLQTNLYDNIKIELLDSIKEKMEGNIEKTLLNKIRVVISFMTSLNNPLFRNIPHGVFFWQFVICCICVFVCLCICVFVFLYLRFWHMRISFLTSLNNPLFKNIPHGGSFWHFVICCICVFVCLCICVFVFGLGRSLLDQFGQKNASPLSSTFWFEQPKLRYVLKTLLHCKGSQISCSAIKRVIL